MNVKNYLMISLLVFCVSNSFSQQNLDIGCGADNLSPKEETVFKESLSKMKNYKSKKLGSYIIPVVFHIIYDGGVSKADMKCRIDDVLETVNGDFNGTFAGFDAIDPRFDAIKDKMDIEFVAATKDPLGTTLEYPGMDWQIQANISYGYDSQIYNYMWWGLNGRYYLDIVVVDAPNEVNGTTGSGHAFLPTQNRVPHVTYNHRYIGRICGAINIPAGFEKVMTHEFGHYFGLRHTFLNGCDATNDGMDDTPATMGSDGCNRNVINACGTYANLENHMDYNVECQNMFTQDQVTAMTYWLDDTTQAYYKRSLLWSQTNLDNTLGELLSTDEFTEDKVVSVYPNPSRDVFTIDLSKLQGQSLTLSIYDVQGKLLSHVKHEKSPSQLNIGDRLTAEGNYFIKIETASKNQILQLIKK